MCSVWSIVKTSHVNRSGKKHARIQRGEQGVLTTSPYTENHNVIGFLGKTGTNPL